MEEASRPSSNTKLNACMFLQKGEINITFIPLSVIPEQSFKWISYILLVFYELAKNIKNASFIFMCLRSMIQSFNLARYTIIDISSFFITYSS